MARQQRDDAYRTAMLNGDEESSNSVMSDESTLMKRRRETGKVDGAGSALTTESNGQTIRFRNRIYVGIPMNLEMAQAESGEMSYTFRTGQTTTRKRKIQNPLTTRFTVRNLKRLLEHQELVQRSTGQCAESVTIAFVDEVVNGEAPTEK